MKEINRVARSPNDGGGGGQRVLTRGGRSAGSTRDEADGGYRIEPVGRRHFSFWGCIATARRRADSLVASATPGHGQLSWHRVGVNEASRLGGRRDRFADALSRVTTYGFWRSQSSNEARYSTIPLREYSRWPSLRNWFM